MAEGIKIAPFSVRYAQAWAEMRNPPLDSVNPHFHNKFASLAATLEAVRSACAPHGITYRQTVQRDGDVLTLVTSVIDGMSGSVQVLSAFPLQYSANPQQFGSALTYAKRQAAQVDWCIVGDEDDDAEAAARQAAEQQAAQRPQEPAPAPQPMQHDYTTVKAELQRLADLHGSSVEEEWAWMCKTLGNPKAMDAAAFANLERVLREMEA